MSSPIEEASRNRDLTASLLLIRLIAVGSILLGSRPVLAQGDVLGTVGDSAPGAGVPPWSVGVTADDRQRAQDFLNVGNELLVQGRYVGALEVYRMAVRLWDHPAIHANMVICHINLGQTLEAYESVLLALRYGAGPFDKPEVYNATRNYRALLESQIGFLDVRCPEPGVVVTLDGQELLGCPGSRQRPLLVGKHRIVAQKPGHLTVTHDFAAGARSLERIELHLVALSEATRPERRWNAAVPLLITGGGGLLVAGGIALQRSAEKEMEAYDRGLERECPGGCLTKPPSPALRRVKKSAEVRSRIAIPAIGAGAATLAVGVVLLILNQPRAVLTDKARSSLQVHPALTHESAGISFEVTF